MRVANVGTAAAAPTSTVVHSAPKPICSIRTAATPAPASAKETASPPFSGGASLRAICFAASDEDRHENQRRARIEKIAVEVAEGDPERGEHRDRDQRAPADPGGCTAGSYSDRSPSLPVASGEKCQGK